VVFERQIKFLLNYERWFGKPESVGFDFVPWLAREVRRIDSILLLGQCARATSTFMSETIWPDIRRGRLHPIVRYEMR
jgi:hypothetical protein